MNQGGEPGRDDDGLPRVDIKIPDDARELDRDVQAYHRELRAMRRRERSRRWREPLRRSGMVVPLIAGCLVLAMIASMVLTMFSANPYFAGINGQEPANSPTAKGGHSSQQGSAATPAPAAGQATAGVPLPGKTISVAGKPIRLRTLTSTALAIVPPGCGCGSLIGQLLTEAQSAGVPVYLVGHQGSQAQLDSYVPATRSKRVFIAIDVNKVLDATYQPVGLTILLVDAHGAVTEAAGIRAVQLAPQLRSLRPTG